MKKVLIIGASGSLAEYVIKALKTLPEVELTLFQRNKKRISPNLTQDCQVIEGDAMN